MLFLGEVKADIFKLKELQAKKLQEILVGII